MKKESVGLLAGAGVLGLAAWLYLHYSGQSNATAMQNGQSLIQPGTNAPYMTTPWGPQALGPVLIGGDTIKLRNTYNAYVNNGGLTVQGGNTSFNLSNPTQPKLLSLFGCSNCGCSSNG